MKFKSEWNIKKIVLCLLSIVVITYGIGAIVLFTNTKIFSPEKSMYNINDEKSININGINTISVNVSSAQINVIPYDGLEVKAHFYGNVTTSSSFTKPELECYLSGDTLYINTKSKNIMTFGFFNYDLKLDVNVPASYGRNLKLDSSSGSINLSSLKLKNLSCNLSSGSTNIKQIYADDFNYNSSSGSLTTENLTTKTSELNSSSGSQRLIGFSGDLKASSSSGSIRAEYASFNNNININASSGSVTVKLPENSDFYLDASASSGSIRSSFPITVTSNNNRHELKGTVTSDKNKISIHTSSGSVNIEK
ncbi:DUF4097 family beta strand repeat-containing protein [Candidatus Clostridium radicumherbarum]|uniref:DUF4097 family beta strand repeat-containing protein n=1 Tax=Candidatus Clostridium radicumherbarum TaxID=3381662 RepID=A0ABW8TUT3_9CLOT